MPILSIIIISALILHHKIYQYYDASQDMWLDLPTLPVRFFGVGQLNRTLVAVGGSNLKMNIKGMNKVASNEVYTYNEQLRTTAGANHTTHADS